MNEQNNRFSLFEPSQRRTPPGRYLSEEERLKRRKKRQQHCVRVGNMKVNMAYADSDGTLDDSILSMLTSL